MAENIYCVEGINFVCAVCLDVWLDRDPKELPCQHTFCNECLRNLPKNFGGFTCPVCRQLTNIFNIKSSSVKKYLSDSKVKSQIEVKLCEKHKNEGVLYCITHHIEYICAECLDDEHKNCETQSMKKKQNIQKVIENCLKHEESELISLKKIIENKKKEIFEKAEMEFTKLNCELDKHFEKRRELIKRRMNFEKLNDKNEILPVDILSEKIQLELMTPFIKTGIEVKVEKINTENIITYFIPSHQISIKIKEKKKILNEKEIENIDIESFLEYLNKNSINEIEEIKISIVDNKTMEFLTHLPNITVIFKIEINKFQDNPDVFLKISDFFSKCYNLISIKIIDSFGFGTKNFLSVKSFLNSSETLQSLELLNFDLNEKYAKDLSITLSNCSYLNYLNLENNLRRFSESHFTQQHRIFEIPSQLSVNLEALNLRNCGLEAENLENLSKFFSNCSKLKYLNLSDNPKLGRTHFRIFESLTKCSDTLEGLDFSRCKLENFIIVKISQLISNCSKLKIVNLRENVKIGREDNSIFINLCKSSKSLECLDVYSCDLNVENVGNISHLFSRCFQLRRVNLGNNINIGNANYPIFKNLLNSSKTLESINLQGCQLNSDARESLNELRMNSLKL